MQFEIVPSDLGIAPAARQSLEDAFSGFFLTANEWKKSAETITDPKMARTARLELKKLRVAANKKRIELKDDYLRMGKAIDGANNILLALIVPIEKGLDEIEKKEERRIEAEKAALIEERLELLHPFINPEGPIPLVSDITQDQFDQMLADAKFLHKAKIDAAAKLEAERVEREMKEAEEREAQRLENIRLKEEAEAREKAMQAERDAAEKERKRLEAEATAKLKAEREEWEKIEANAKAERDRLEAIAESERRQAAAAAELAAKEKATLEAEAQRLRDAEAKRIADEKAAADAKAKADALAAKKAESAPDKAKLMGFANTVRSLEVPSVKSLEALDVRCDIEEKIISFARWIETQAATL